MVKIVIFIENKSKDAAHHFSIEELFTRIIKLSEPVLMLWQTDNTVMLGNNQIVEAEVDLDFAAKTNINIVRRSSGGGAIYTDNGTILYTVIQPLTENAKFIREETAENVIDVLKNIGVSAYREGRNDILLDGKKISGFAQYTSGKHICTHGSLLYDADIENLTSALIPNDDKLQPKGIASIRSRVTNIRPYVNENYSTADFFNILKEGLLANTQYRTYKLSNEELAKVEKIKNDKYGNSEWNFNYNLKG